MELSNPRISCLQHLDISHGSDCFDVVGIEMIEEAIHDFPPAPEVIVVWPAMLCQTGHAALEGMAVNIAEPRKSNSGSLVTGKGRCADEDA